jgi:mannonate dehydratase
MAAYHVDISSSAFGIQEENHFPQSVHDMFPGIAEVRRGYMYGSDRPGLGLDVNEELAAKNPIGPILNGGAYPTDRKIDGMVVKP